MSGGLRYVVTGVLALACASAAAQSATGSFERTMSVAEPIELYVSTGSGAITIAQGPAGQIEVLGTIRVGASRSRTAAEAEALVRELEQSPPIEVNGGSVRIGYIDDDEYRENVSISYEITVPQATAATSRTGSGDQTVSGLRGRVTVGTGSGEVTLADIGGPVEARTGSGDISAERIAGAFDGNTGSGSISLAQTASGDVNVATGSGEINLRGVAAHVEARTGSGSITLDGIPSSPWNLQTGSGSVVMRVPPDAAFSLDVRSSSGQVQTSHPVTIEGAVERGTLRGDVRGGGALVHARTGSGSIRIE